ncbi:MAG TPA: glycosyltransferase family 39 protein, partial [Oceanobacillus sp.]|nr:glycosyltransferase family 39 protein [Oceanobacillus sp.]
MQTSLRSLILFVGILLLATSARLFQIQTQSLWFDEGWSAYAANQPTLIDAANADATNPPLYYVLLNISARFLGDSEFSLRLFSLFCGLLVIALSYRFAKYLFGGRAGLFAALLAAASPLLWWASQEARMYTLLAALVLICTFAWHSLQVRPSTRMWLMLWGSELALLYAHNTGLVVAIWLNVVTVLAWLINRSIVRSFNWRWWLGGQVLVMLLWSPYFFTRYVNLAEANSAVVSAPDLTPEFALQLWQSFWQTPWERVLLSGES